MRETIALRRDIPPGLRAAARGVVAIAAVVAVVTPITCTGQTHIALFAAVLVGIYAGLWAGRHSNLAALIGVMLVPGIGIALAVMTDIQLFGSNPGTISVRDAAHYPFAARMRFADARVATEYTGSVDRATRLPPDSTGTWRAAPIVPSDWRPTEPVPAWAVVEVSIYGSGDFRSPRSWIQPFNAGVRYVSDLTSGEQAAAAAAERHGLTSAEGAPLLYWVESPGAAIAQERATLAWLVLGGVIAWLVCIISERLLGGATPRPVRVE